MECGRLTGIMNVVQGLGRYGHSGEENNEYSGCILNTESAELADGVGDWVKKRANQRWLLGFSPVRLGEFRVGHTEHEEPVVVPWDAEELQLKDWGSGRCSGQMIKLPQVIEVMGRDERA